MNFYHASISFMSSSFLSPFFPAISKISEDQVAKIENEKEGMKERRNKRRKKIGGGPEKDFSRMQKKTGIFSAYWECPHQVVTAAPMAVLRKHSPFSFCLHPFRLKAPYGNYSHCSDYRFGPQPLLSKPHRRPGKNFFLRLPAMVYTYKANTRC